MTAPLRIVYMLEDTDLAGGIRVAVAQADALTERGHEVTLATKGGPLQWRRSLAKWIHVSDWSELDLAPYDFVVGTFWKTLFATYELAGDRAVHFCQGYEGSFTAYAAMRGEIEAAYRLPMPKITVSPHLVDICRRFYDDATYVGQIVDDVFYQPHAPRGGVPRVLLVGPAQADFKGIDIGYEAARLARENGATFDLVRATPWHPIEGEPAELASEMHVAIGSDEMARLIASCDVFLGPSLHQEGFGLPAAESLASGVACVLSRIPSFLSWDARHDFALFVDEGDAMAMSEALARLVDDAELRSRLALRGREVVEQFRTEHTGARLEQYFLARRDAR